MSIRLLSILALLSSASVAHAQGGPPPPPPQGGPGSYGPPQGGYYQPPVGPQRGGFLLGIAGGVGSMSFECDFCTNDSFGGFAFDFNIGGFVGPNLALMYDASIILHPESEAGFDYVLTNATNTLAVQTWVNPQLWLRGGAGMARLFLTGDIEDEGETGFGLSGAAGFELAQADNFALDARVRVGTGFYDGGNASNIGVLVGANWY